MGAHRTRRRYSRLPERRFAIRLAFALLLALAPALGFAAATPLVPHSSSVNDEPAGHSMPCCEHGGHGDECCATHAECTDCTAPCGSGLTAMAPVAATGSEFRLSNSVDRVDLDRPVPLRIVNALGCRGPPPVV